MVRCSNSVFTILNFVALLLGIASIAAAFTFFSSHGHGSHVSICHRTLHTPLLFLGLALTVVSAFGLIGLACRSGSLLVVYSLVMFLMIVGLLVFSVFAFLVTNPGAGNAVSGLGFGEYKLGNYSKWLKNHFVNDKNWDAIRSCLYDAQVCNSLVDNNNVDQKISDFYKKQLTSIQSGCCKPPADCGFRYENGGLWMAPETGPAVEDKDCTAWSSDEKKLCYGCDSCKAGVLDNIKKQWRHLAVFNVVVTLLAVLVFSTGCCARRNIVENHWRHHAHLAHP